MEEQVNVKRYLDILRRRWLQLVIPAILVFAAACVLAYKLPRVYEASATILVESQQIPTDLASPTVTANAAERIQVIQQRLLTRDNLLQIATKFGLYDSERGSLSPTEIVDRMRKAIRIAQIDVGMQVYRRDIGVIGFTVSFADESPSLSSSVTNELVTSILSQNIQTRLSRAGETSNFFKQQLSRLEQDLLSMEARIAAFKRDNEAALPETLPYRRTLLLQLSTEITEIDGKIRMAGAPIDEAARSDDARVRQLGYRLKAKELELASTREQRDTLAPLAERDIVPQNRVRDLDRALASIELEIESIKADLAAQDGVGGGDALRQQLQGQRNALAEQAATLNESIIKTPQVEVELSALMRDYENLQAEYRDTKAKLANAQTGERLEEDRQAERFEVIEQATVPDEPIKPEPRKIILAGSAGSLAVGVGVVAMVELLFRSIRSAADLERVLRLRPIATIPYIATLGERRRRRRILLLLVVAAAVAILGGMFVIDTYYLPLDLIYQKVATRIGLAMP